MPSVAPRLENLTSLIYLIRGEKVMLDADLAGLSDMAFKVTIG